MDWDLHSEPVPDTDDDMRSAWFRLEGRSLTAARAYRARFSEAFDRCMAFAAEFGAAGFYAGHDGAMRGLAPVKPLPPGWRLDAHGRMVPHKGCSEGKALTARLRALSVPRASRVLGRDPEFTDDTKRMGDTLLMHESGRFWSALRGIKEQGEVILAAVVFDRRQGEPPIPLDAVPLRMSEVWALREQAQVQVAGEEAP